MCGSYSLSDVAGDVIYRIKEFEANLCPAELLSIYPLPEAENSAHFPSKWAASLPSHPQLPGPS